MEHTAGGGRRRGHAASASSSATARPACSVTPGEAEPLRTWRGTCRWRPGGACGPAPRAGHLSSSAAWSRADPLRSGAPPTRGGSRSAIRDRDSNVPARPCSPSGEPPRAPDRRAPTSALQQARPPRPAGRAARSRRRLPGRRGASARRTRTRCLRPARQVDALAGELRAPARARDRRASGSTSRTRASAHGDVSTPLLLEQQDAQEKWGGGTCKSATAVGDTIVNDLHLFTTAGRAS